MKLDLNYEYVSSRWPSAAQSFLLEQFIKDTREWTGMAVKVYFTSLL